MRCRRPEAEGCFGCQSRVEGTPGTERRWYLVLRGNAVVSVVVLVVSSASMISAVTGGLECGRGGGRVGGGGGGGGGCITEAVMSGGRRGSHGEDMDWEE